MHFMVPVVLLIFIDVITSHVGLPDERMMRPAHCRPRRMMAEPTPGRKINLRYIQRIAQRICQEIQFAAQSLSWQEHQLRPKPGSLNMSCVKNQERTAASRPTLWLKRWIDRLALALFASAICMLAAFVGMPSIDAFWDSISNTTLHTFTGPR